MHILITGGAGFIGINLTIKLLKQGHKVTVLDNFITADKNNIKNLLREGNLNFIESDICRELPKEISRKNYKQIYHLACPTGVPNLVKRAREMLLTCSVGTLNILELARKNGSSFLFTSSSEVYGEPQIFPHK